MCCDNGILKSHIMSSHEIDTWPGDDPALTPQPGTSLHYALLLVPASHRPLARVALAAWKTMARIPMSLSDPGVAEAKLLWWQDAWGRAAAGQAEHPILQSLNQQLQASGQSWPAPALWQPQIAGWIQLAHQNRWIDQDSLDRHIDATTGHAARWWCGLLGAGTPPAQDAAHRLGMGLRRAHLLSRLGQDARAGWVMVGIDLLQQNDVKAHQIIRPGETPPAGWSSLLDALVRAAQHDLRAGWQQARALAPADRRALLPLLAMARCADALVSEIGQSQDTILHQRMMLTPARKAWLCWQTRWGLGGMKPPSSMA